MAKHLFLIHGRSFKPAQAELEGNWLTAARHGLVRDHGAQLGDTFDGVDKFFAYYGDISNAFLVGEGQTYDEAADVADRTACLATLSNYAAGDFLDEDGKRNYEGLPGKTSLWEFLADVVAGPLALLGLSEPIVSLVAPDMREYWNPETAFGSDVRWILTDPLAAALHDGDDIMLVSHSLGTMISFDVLWKFSYYGEYENLRQAGNKIDTWVTLGCPLGDATVKQNLKGAGASGVRRYPNLIRNWINIAAEDDFVAHDETVSDDYRRMEAEGQIESIEDQRIYNLAVRHGGSNPHHGAGYLIHPTFTDHLAAWLQR